MLTERNPLLTYWHVRLITSNEWPQFCFTHQLILFPDVGIIAIQINRSYTWLRDMLKIHHSNPWHLREHCFHARVAKVGCQSRGWIFLLNHASPRIFVSLALYYTWVARNSLTQPGACSQATSERVISIAIVNLQDFKATWFCSRWVMTLEMI